MTLLLCLVVHKEAYKYVLYNWVIDVCYKCTFYINPNKALQKKCLLLLFLWTFAFDEYSASETFFLFMVIVVTKSFSTSAPIFISGLCCHLNWRCDTKFHDIFCLTIRHCKFLNWQRRVCWRITCKFRLDPHTVLILCSWIDGSQLVFE